MLKLLLILLFIFSVNSIYAKNIPLPPDPYEQLRLNEINNSHSKELQKLAKTSSSLIQFYVSAMEILDGYIVNESTLFDHKNDIVDLLWCLYRISITPFYEDPDAELGKEWIYEYAEDRDIMSKYRVFMRCSILPVGSLGKILHVNHNKIKKFNLSIMAHILLAFNKKFDSSFEGKYIKISDRIIYQNFNDEDIRIICWNNLQQLDTRNKYFKAFISHMETEFIQTTLKYFPDQASVLIEYLRMSGYSDREILLLAKSFKSDKKLFDSVSVLLNK